MRMPTRVKATAEAQPEQYPLPDGYDDPTGPTYVPEEYRAAWHVHAGDADTRTDREATIRVLAEYRAYRDARPEKFIDRPGGLEWNVDPKTGAAQGERGTIKGEPPHLLARAAEMGHKGASILFAQTLEGRDAVALIALRDRDELKAEAEHALRLFHVQIEHEYQERQRDMKNVRERRNLCPVCHTSSEEGGQPVTREIVPSGSSGWGRLIKIHSCAGCYLAAVSYWTTRLAVAPFSLDGTRSRLEVVREHFDSRDL